jgi:hypothetical protein
VGSARVFWKFLGDRQTLQIFYLRQGVRGVAAAALLLTLVVPRAVRAVAALLVQVNNTASAPAITQNVPNLASQIVTRCH